MELYNFFTEILTADRIEDLELCKSEIIKEFEGKGHCEIVLFEGITGEKRYSIIGQIYGSDTSVGDTDLLSILSGIKYTWIYAYNPEINNITEL